MDGGEAPLLMKDITGQFMIVSEDANGRSYPKPFRLLSNTVETSLEMHAVQQDITIPSENPQAN